MSRLKMRQNRSRGRQLKNVFFTIVMLAQILFWTHFLASVTSKSMDEHLETKSLTDEHIETKRLTKTSAKMAEEIKDQPVVVKAEALIKVNQVEMHAPDKTDRDPTPNRPQRAPSIHAEVVVVKPATPSTPAKPIEDTFNKYLDPIIRHTILPRSESAVIWNGSFSLNPTNLCSDYPELDLLVIVHTAPYNRQRRAMLRQQLHVSKQTSPYTLQPVFMIGSTKKEKQNSTEEAFLKEEFTLHKDIVMMDFVEDFRNLSLKAIMWLKWTNLYCKTANMILKIDDDVAIDVLKILPLSRGLFSRYSRSIFCYVNKIGSQPIPRRGRTAVDPREFARMAFYPYTYCSGFIVFFTPDLLPVFQNTARHIPFYNVDDVYMFGMVPKFSGRVTYHNLGFNVSIWNTKVLRCYVGLGSSCPYFGTMAEKDEERIEVWNAMKQNHVHDFHFPKIFVQ